MTTPTLQQKILFHLASLAGGVSGKNPPPDPEAALYQLIIEDFQKYQSQIGTWNVVWGPVVVTYDTFYYPINAIYIAQSGDDPSQYVVSVAGTNPVSFFDWIVEDALVAKQIPWPFDPGQGGAISLGTAIGLVILLSSSPSGDRPGAGQTIRQFLASLSSKKITVTTGGHSLGGALSPTLGLWLKNTQILWDPLFQAKFASMPTAGPTPGNSAFAQYLSEKIPLVRFWNLLDIVPHAWVETLLAELPTIYAPDIPSDLAIEYLAQLGEDAAAGGDYTQLCPDSSFPSAVNKDIIHWDWINLKNYLYQVAYQHTVAYTDYFAISGVTADAIAPFEPEPVIHPAVIARAASRLSVPPPPELLALSPTDATATQPITVPVNGVAVPLPASADDPATDAIASAIQAQLNALSAI